MEISNLKRNVAAIEAGEWVDRIPGFGDGRLRVRGMGSKLYTATLARLTRAVPREDRERDNSLKPETAIRVMAEAMAETVLLEWGGLTDGGKTLKYDPDLAKAWMLDPTTRPFLDAVVYAASVVENGRAATTEAIEKN